jgi:hypothetical protein
VSNEINDKTKIPLGFIITVAGLFAGGIVHVSMISFKANANENRIEKIEKKNEDLVTVILETRESLARIEGALGVDKK